MLLQDETHTTGPLLAEKRRWVWYLAAALLFGLAIAKLAYQDVYRLAYPLNDLTTIWVSAKSFLHGHNPYQDMAEFNRIWSASPVSVQSAHADYGPVLSHYPMAYPPTTMVLVSPLGLFSWHVALWVYLVGAITLFVLAVLLLAERLNIPWGDPRKQFFCAFAFALAPLHSGIHEVNLNTAVIAFLCLAMGFLSSTPWMTGITLGIAICLKPQVAFLFLVYLCFRSKWKAAFSTLATGAFILVIGTVWMYFHHIDWWKAYRAALTQFSSSSGANSFYSDGLGKFQLLNLQVLVFQFVHRVGMTQVISWGLLALLAGVSAFFVISRVSDRNDSVGIAVVSVLTLLPVYQRFYTAEILVFVLYWAMHNINLSRAKAALALMIPLLFPFTAWAERSALMMRWTGPGHSGMGILANNLLLPHVIWIELLLLGLLLSELFSRSGDTRSAGEEIVGLP